MLQRVSGNRRARRSGVFALLALVAASAFAQEPQSAAPVELAQAGDPLLDRRVQVEIRPQSLASAIIELSKLAKVQLLVRGGQLTDLSTPGLRGEMSLREALQRLLAGTGYSFRKANESTIGIDPPKTSQAEDAGAESAMAGVIVADAAASATIAVTSITTESETLTSRSAAAGRPGVQRLDDIVVTATKREKSARDIPVSISAIRGEDLEKMGARDMKDYMMLVPGLSMDENDRGEAGGRRLIVRGVGPSAVDGNQTVGQFIGDIPMTDPVGNRFTPDLDPFDLKTVEVLKGPQGTTFGATALNGAIRYVPNLPELGQWHTRGFVDLSQSRFGSLSKAYGAAANVPVGETLALRAAGVLQDSGGLYDNLQRDEIDADSRRKWSARGMLRWLPWEPLSIDLTWLRQHSHADDLLTGDIPDSFTTNSKPGPSYWVTDFGLKSIDARYDLGDWGTAVWQSSLQTKHIDGDIDASVPQHGQYGIELLRGAVLTDVKGRTHELRWVSAEGEHWNWIVGAFEQDYSLYTSTYGYVRNPADFALLAQILPALNTFLTPDLFIPQGINVVGAFVGPLEAKERSFYGELSRRFGEHWEVTVGARRYQTSIHSIVGNTGVLAAELFVENYGSTTRTQNQSDKGISPKLSVAWKPSENLMVYGLVARGFQFGGVNLPPSFSFPNPIYGTHPIEYASSNLWNREIGVRTDWLDRTLRVDATIYDINWNNAQIQQVSEGALLGSTYTDNVGKVLSRGIESTLTWLTPLPGLSLNLAGSYSRAYTAAATVNNGQSIPAGAPMPAAPPVQVATSLAYSTYFGPWVGNAGLTYAYWSKSYSNLQKTFDIYDFGQFGINTSIVRPDWTGAPSLSLGVQNLLDERGLIGRRGSTGTGTSLVGNAWTYVRPRTISLRLTAQFD